MSIIKILKKPTTMALLIFHTVFFLILLRNFPVDKFVIGWDALNPEFNFALNFKRAFTAFWQENYGLGTLGGHGFASTLPHTIITWMLSFILPQWAIRTAFTFLCFYLGGLGMFFLVRRLLKDGSAYISLIAALFYLLNLGTVQMFYIQLEAFIFHFAVLPWLFWSAIQVWEKNSRRNLLIFFAINILASGQGFIPPLFVAYMFALGIFLLILTSSQRFARSSVKKSVLIVILTLFINAYWLIPVSYYTITKSNVYLNSYNNLSSTPEFLNKNKKYGDLANVSLIKGFIFEALDSTQNNQVYHVFQPWIDHQNEIPVKMIGWVFFAISVLGLLFGIFRIKNPYFTALSGVYIFFFTGLTTDFFPFSLVTEFLQNYVPIYRQAFRAAFTKFSLGVGFSYSIFTALGVYALWGFFRRKMLFIVLLAALLYYSLPYFKGNFFYYRLLQKVPTSYFEIFAYFKDKPDGRIADLPQDCPQGWYNYNWEYTGSGFYWYAIKQPFLSRSFDVWSNYNENYYWELLQALRSKNFFQAEQVLKKYNVKWILYDPNILFCRSGKAILYNEEFLDYLQRAKSFSLIKTFRSSGIKPIKLFELHQPAGVNSFVTIVKNLPNVGPSYKWGDRDEAFLRFGEYLSNPEKNYDVFFPFRSLFTKRKSEEREFSILDQGNSFAFQTTIPENLIGNNLIIQTLKTTEKYIPIVIELKALTSKQFEIFLTYVLPKITINNQLIGDTTTKISLGSFANPTESPIKIVVNDIEAIKFGNNTYVSALFFTLTNKLQVVDSTNKLLFQWVDTDDPVYQKINRDFEPSAITITQTGNLSVEIPKFVDKNFQGFEFFNDVSSHLPKPCNEPIPTNRNKFEFKNENGKEFIRLISQNSRQCIIYNLPQLSNAFNYLIEVRSRKVIGNNPVFYVSNRKGLHILDAYLYSSDRFQSHFFMLPSTFQDEIGYDIYFDNYSQNNYQTINDFAGIGMWSVPYSFLASISIENPSTLTFGSKQFLPLSNVSHPNDTMYHIEAASINQDNIDLVLFQSFDLDWKAYYVNDINIISKTFPFFFGQELKNHVLVNNWANGWHINIKNQIVNSKNTYQISNIKTSKNNLTTQPFNHLTIVIIFFPQYLQFLGFGLLAISFLAILKIKDNNKRAVSSTNQQSEKQSPHSTSNL